MPASMPGFPAAQDESSPRDTAERSPCWPREPILGWFHHPADALSILVVQKTSEMLTRPEAVGPLWAVVSGRSVEPLQNLEAEEKSSGLEAGPDSLPKVGATRRGSAFLRGP